LQTGKSAEQTHQFRKIQNFGSVCLFFCLRLETTAKKVSLIHSVANEETFPSEKHIQIELSTFPFHCHFPHNLFHFFSYYLPPTRLKINPFWHSNVIFKILPTFPSESSSRGKACEMRKYLLFVVAKLWKGKTAATKNAFRFFFFFVRDYLSADFLF